MPRRYLVPWVPCTLGTLYLVPWVPCTLFLGTFSRHMLYNDVQRQQAVSFLTPVPLFSVQSTHHNFTRVIAEIFFFCWALKTNSGKKPRKCTHHQQCTKEKEIWHYMKKSRSNANMFKHMQLVPNIKCCVRRVFSLICSLICKLKNITCLCPIDHPTWKAVEQT